MKVNEGSCKQMHVHLHQALPSLQEIFCDPNNVITVNNTPFRGLAFFVKSRVPMWEHPSVAEGCDVVWGGGLMSANVLAKCVAFLMAYVASTDGCCGFRLINKNRQGMGMTKIEVWFDTVAAAKRQQTLLKSEMQKCTGLASVANQFSRITTHRSKLQRCR